MLLASGLTIVFVSISRHLIEIFIILGVVLAIIGVYILTISFLNSGKTTKLQEFQKNLNNSKKGNSKEDSKNNVLQSNNSNNDNNNKNNNKKTNIVSNLGNNLANNKLSPIDTKKITEKVKDVSKSKNPKSVLKPKKPKSNINNKKFKFTPNYERPMKVTRRPRKKSKSLPNNAPIDLNTVEGGKSEAIVKALASDDFISPIHAKSKYEDNNDSSKSIKSKLNDAGSNNSFNPNSLANEQDIKGINNNAGTLNGINDLKINDSKFNNTELSKFSKSYVVCSKGTMTSKEAFDELAKGAKEEILLEISSIKDMDDKFLSKISSLNVRIIIEEFDIKDMSYVLLITSLLEQGIKIRILPLITTINLIADDSHALIISESDPSKDLDIGAVYNDSKSISNIKYMFEKSWDLANDLDVNNINNF